MAYEQFQNGGYTTLASGYTSGSGSISVTSAATFPSSGNFRVTILDAATATTVKVVLKVTAVSGTTFTATAEGTDASCSAGDIVIGTAWTAAAITALRDDISKSGTYANLPASGMTKGDQYRCTDSPLEFFYNGSAWEAYLPGYGKVTKPSSNSFSWLNSSQGTSTVTDVGSLAIAFQTNSGTDNLRCYGATLPASTGYTLIIGFRFVSQAVGVGISDGTKWIVIYTINGTILRFQKWNSTTSFSASYISDITLSWSPAVVWLKIQDVSSTRKIYIAANGVTGPWRQLDSQASATFLTETKAAIIMETNGTENPREIEVVHFSMTTP